MMNQSTQTTSLLDDEDELDSNPNMAMKTIQHTMMETPTTTSVGDEDEDNEDPELALLPDAERNARREANKPDISWLADAIDWNADTPSKVGFLLKKNDYVVIERRITNAKDSPWLDTRVYQLLADPAENGDLKLYDPNRQQHAQSNWKAGVLKGLQFRRPPPGTNPETLIDANGKIQKRKRQKAVMIAAPVDPNAPKRGRGRPKGAKNRSKEIIEAEKAERRVEQDEKRARREARRTGWRR